MKNSKSIKKTFAIILIALALIVSTCVSILCAAKASQNKADVSVERMLQDANNSVNEFSADSAYNYFTFTDSIYSKVNMASIAVDENASAEELEKIARNLNLNSFIMADEKGNVTVAYPNELKGTNILDNKELVQFKANLNGTSFKKNSTPQPIKGEDGKYNVLAAVHQPDGGAMIIDTDVDNYGIVTGENIADVCKGSTIIAIDDNIISTNININGKNSLKELGVDSTKLEGETFNLKIGDKKYRLKAASVNEYTVISGVDNSQFDVEYMYSVIIPIAANAFIFIIFTVAVIILSRKKED